MSKLSGWLRYCLQKLVDDKSIASSKHGLLQVDCQNLHRLATCCWVCSKDSQIYFNIFIPVQDLLEHFETCRRSPWHVLPPSDGGGLLQNLNLVLNEFFPQVL